MRPHFPLLHSIRRYTPPSDIYKSTSDPSSRFFSAINIRILGEPTVVKNQRARDTLSAMPKAGFYAVHTGYQPGIYLSWPEAEAQVKGFPAAKYKKFPTEAAAHAYVRATPSEPYSAPRRMSTPTLKARSSRQHVSGPSRTPSTVNPDPKPRATSPPTSIDVALLPPDLQSIAGKGYTFSRDKRLVVYTDGSGLGNGQVGAKAGLGVYWGKEGDAGKRNLSERVPGALQTNNRGEILSVIRAVELCPFPELPLEIRTDSQYTISCMTTYLPTWIRNNFRPSRAKTSSRPRSTSSASNGTSLKQVKNADLIKHLLVLLRRRGRAGVKFKYVAAHVGWEGNEAADRLAKMGANLPAVPDRTDWLDPEDDDDISTFTMLGTQKCQDAGSTDTPIDIDVEVDESWLLTAEELETLERDFQLESAQELAA